MQQFAHGQHIQMQMFTRYNTKQSDGYSFLQCCKGNINHKSTNQVRLDEMKIMAFDIPWPTQWLCKHRDCLVQHEQHTLDCFQCTHGHSKQAGMQKNYSIMSALFQQWSIILLRSNFHVAP